MFDFTEGAHYCQLNRKKEHTSAPSFTKGKFAFDALFPRFLPSSLFGLVVSTRFVDSGATSAEEMLESTFFGHRKDHLGRFEKYGGGEGELLCLGTEW
jgi:hypothetical protein